VVSNRKDNEASMSLLFSFAVDIKELKVGGKIIIGGGL
jgi:hypothetical protein